jgi:putative aldouronate transport system substrate-binding protein
MQTIRGKIAAFAALLLLGIAITACGGESNPASSPSTAAPNENEVTLRFYFGGDKKSAADEVWKAISDYVKSKGLDVKFDISTIPFGEYKDKMLVMSASGDEWDLNFDGYWLAFHQMAGKGAYLNLNDLLPKFAPHLYQKYKETNTLQAATVNGQIVALPWTMEMNARPYLNWRSDLTKKAGINPAPGSIRTIEDVDLFAHWFKMAYPNKKFARFGPLPIFLLRDELLDIGYHGLVVSLNDPKLRVMPVEQTQAYRDALKMAKKWYDDGIINKDMLVDREDGGIQWRNGKMLLTLNGHEWTFNKTNFAEPDAEREGSLLYPEKKTVNRTVLANVLAINRNSKNADRILRFLDMVETDQKLYDLLVYGLSGKTYVLKDRMAVYPEGMNTSTSNYMEWGGQWAFWKPQFMRPDPTYPEGFWAREAEFAHESHNIPSPIDGLFISEDKVKTEIAKRDQLGTDIGRVIEAGIISGSDVDKVADDYIAKQKSAGLDKIVADAQLQVDAFLASKNK